jgi:hypothetical protein
MAEAMPAKALLKWICIKLERRCLLGNGNALTGFSSLICDQRLSQLSGSTGLIEILSKSTISLKIRFSKNLAG